MGDSSRVVAVFFMLLLAGHEAHRITQMARIARQALDQQRGNSSLAAVNLDDECASSKKCKKEGCGKSYIWLDTPSQICRYKEEYKLQNRQSEFLREALDRLEEKTTKFANTGCLFTGVSKDTYMFKCVRRTKQIVRLMRFAGKVIKAAKEDPSHPAAEYVATGVADATMRRCADNIATGFDKYEGSMPAPLNFAAAYRKMMGLPEVEAKIREVCDCETCECDMSEHERSAEISSHVSESMLLMMNVELAPEQRAALMSQLEDDEQSGALQGVTMDKVLDGLQSDIDAAEHIGMIRGSSAITAVSKPAKNEFKAQLGDLQEQEIPNEPEDAAQVVSVGEPSEAAAGNRISTALVELGDSPARTKQPKGTGPFKWLVKHGLGWLVLRIGWLLLFTIGAAIGLIRAAVVFPLLFAICFLARFIKLITYDFFVSFGWYGQEQELVEGVKDMGRCAPQMWEAVGFDAGQRGWDLPSQIVVQPAMFASKITNVHHLWKSARDVCEDVQCGDKAVCQGGKCYCQPGYYPTGDASGSCGLMASSHGCTCLAEWSKTDFGISSKHYGCAYGSCKVDRAHSSYQTCKQVLIEAMSKTKRVFKTVVAGAKGGSVEPKKDKCHTGPFRALVPHTLKPPSSSPDNL